MHSEPIRLVWAELYSALSCFVCPNLVMSETLSLSSIRAPHSMALPALRVAVALPGALLFLSAIADKFHGSARVHLPDPGARGGRAADGPAGLDTSFASHIEFVVGKSEKMDLRDTLAPELTAAGKHDGTVLAGTRASDAPLEALSFPSTPTFESVGAYDTENLNP